MFYLLLLCEGGREGGLTVGKFLQFLISLLAQSVPALPRQSQPGLVVRGPGGGGARLTGRQAGGSGSGAAAPMGRPDRITTAPPPARPGPGLVSSCSSSTSQYFRTKLSKCSPRQVIRVSGVLLSPLVVSVV